MQYHLVKPESAIQDFCTVKRHFEDKNHYEMVAVKGKDDPTVEVVKQFIAASIWFILELELNLN